MKIKLPIPIERHELANRAAIRAHSVRGEENYKVAYSKIHVRQDHNERILFGDLDWLAGNIEAVGLINPIRVDMLQNGDCYITNGERRYRAIGILIAKGSKRFPSSDAHIKVIINPQSFTEVDRIKISLSENNLGKPFEPIEEAHSFAKLLGQIDPDTGKTIRAADIARMIGCSKMHVTHRLALAGISEEEKQAVTDGEISATAMTEMVKAGLDEQQRIELLDKAKASGSTVKIKDIVKKSPRANSQKENKDQQEGLFTRQSGNSPVLTLASEGLLLLKGIHHQLQQPDGSGSLEAVNEQLKKLEVALRDLQKIGQAL